MGSATGEGQGNPQGQAHAAKRAGAAEVDRRPSCSAALDQQHEPLDGHPVVSDHDAVAVLLRFIGALEDIDILGTHGVFAPPPADLLDKRRMLLDDWTAYCAGGGPPGATVASIKSLALGVKGD